MKVWVCNLYKIKSHRPTLTKTRKKNCKIFKILYLMQEDITYR